jgi:hypothetical protein
MQTNGQSMALGSVYLMEDGIAELTGSTDGASQSFQLSGKDARLVYSRGKLR